MARSKSWTVKGIDAEARDAARTAAKNASEPIGVWVDRAILGHAAPDADSGAGGATAEAVPAANAIAARVAEHASRVSRHLEPVKETIATLESRLHALETSIEAARADDAADETGLTEDGVATDEGEDSGAEMWADDDPLQVVDPAARETDEDVAEDEPAASEDDREDRLREPALESDLGPGDLTDRDIETADSVVREELRSLFDDGDHARAAASGGEIVPPPLSETAPRSRPLYLLLIAGLLVATAIAIVVFVWFELATPEPPAALDSPVPETAAAPPPPAPVAPAGDTAPDRSSEPPCGAPEPAPPAEPDAGPRPPRADAPRADAERDETNAPGPLPDPELATPAPAAPAVTDSEDPEIAELRTRALDGDRASQNALAIRYLVGRGVPLDYAEAAKWLREAASQGLASAQYNLGVLYDSGRGVDPDPVEALIWFQAAAEDGHGGAQYALAAAYAAGRGIERNPDIALRWLRRAADSNVREAQSSLANILAANPPSRDNLVEAYRWYLIADANGDARAADQADQMAARLTPDERARANREASAFIARNVARVPRPARQPAAASPASTSTAPAPATAAADPAPDTAGLGRDAIRQIQSLLATLGFRPGAADGAAGPQTRNAIREYQEMLGLPADGEPSADLLAHIRRTAGVEQ